MAFRPCADEIFLKAALFVGCTQTPVLGENRPRGCTILITVRITIKWAMEGDELKDLVYNKKKGVGRPTTGTYPAYSRLGKRRGPSSDRFRRGIDVKGQ